MSSDNTALGDRMKAYEKVDSIQFSGTEPVIARLDGRAFHSLTRGFNKPFDDRFISWMDSTCNCLLEEINPIISYVQSDEISLVFKNKTEDTQPPFGGKGYKLVSVLASMTTGYFNKIRYKECGLSVKPANFDCRAFIVPTESEAINYLLWRYRDCRRNSVLSFSQCEFGKKKIFGINISQLLEKIDSNNEIRERWNAVSKRNKYGVFMRKEPYECSAVFNGRTVNVTRSKVVKLNIFEDNLTHDELIDFVFGKKRT